MTRPAATRGRAGAHRAGPRVVGALVLMSAAALLGAACSGSDGAPAPDAAPAPSGDGSVTASSTTTTALPATGCGSEDIPPVVSPVGTHPVGRTTRTYVDTTRGTDEDVVRATPAQPTRTLPATVLYPAAGTPTEPGLVTDEAPPAEGVFPMVTYSPGVWSNGTERNDTFARWASAGYVVVALTFPLSSAPGAGIDDLVNQPTDVVFVTGSFSAQVATGTSTDGAAEPLAGHVATDCLALAGHSLGGATTFAAAFDPCCTRIEPRAVVAIAGVLLPVTPGAVLADSPSIPAMIVHGTDDPRVTYDQGERAFRELTGDRWLVTLEGGDHNSMFVAPQSGVLDLAVLGLLDAELKGDVNSIGRMIRALPGAGVPSRIDESTI